MGEQIRVGVDGLDDALPDDQWEVFLDVGRVRAGQCLGTNSSIGGFLLVKSILSPALAASAVVTSYAIFRLTMRNRNVRIQWANHQPWAVARA